MNTPKSAGKPRVVSKLDVARLAGVSHMTVTRVLQDHPQVKPETRHKVLEACDQLNYRCNLLASALRRGKSLAIGVVVPVLDVPIFGRLVNGIEERTAELGYNIVVIQEERAISEAEKRKKLEFLLQRQCDGLVIDAQLPPNLTNLLLNQRVPTVIVEFPAGPFSRVATDDEAGTREAMNYLIGLGHKKIAHLAGSPGTGHGDVRRQTYMDVLRENNIEVREELIVETNYKLESGHRVMRELLAKTRDFTAVFAAGDHVALGAMLAIHEYGMKIPDDISIVGYSGDTLTEYSIPPLTTIYQPFEEMGKTAVDLLMSQFQSETDEPIIRLMPTRLIERQSCAKIN
ncbi:LacI family transcriptional regulator [bacterium]|nr:LacI family transcriptional regulator [bacterium]